MSGKADRSQNDNLNIKDMANRFKRFYTALVYDIMEEMGLPNQCLDLDIKPLDRHMRVAGPAFTVLGGPDPRGNEENPEASEIANFDYYDRMYPGAVIVVSAGGKQHCGHWGELLSNAAKAQGVAGIVIDGGIRDGNLLLEIEDWPVFARYTSPIGAKLRYRMRDFQIPVAMSGTLTSQVRVEPGDWIFGDMDGVLVIPKSIVGEVLARAEEAKIIEDKVREEVRQGIHVRDVRKKYGRL